MKNIAVIIPAYNEERRIGRTLIAYLDYFQAVSSTINVHYIVVLNGCTDTSSTIVGTIAQSYKNIQVIDVQEAGKGLAVAIGFKAALRLYPLVDGIGFVDSDMATGPSYFYDLIKELKGCDGVIASRYMPGSKVYPPRPLIKRIGSLLMYDSLVRLLFGMRYHDVQCGAKMFTRSLIEKVAPDLHVRQWSFDVELLYLANYYGFVVKEVPTTWHDQADSKLSIIRDGLRMPLSLIQLRFYYWKLLFGNKPL